MKKRILAVCVLIIILSSAFPLLHARADMIYEPVDKFFQRNKSKCEYLSRSFYANGEAGYISFRTEPGASKEVSKFRNGEDFYVMYTYVHDGEKWGIAEFYTGAESGRLSGWVPMSDLLLIYDNIAFEDEFGKGFYQYSGDYELLFEANELVFWTWPGSGEIAMTFDMRDGENERTWLRAADTYKDNEGREWGQIAYFYGRRNTWVCLDDPGNSKIAAFNAAPQPALYPPASVLPDDNGKSGAGTQPGGLPPLVFVIIPVIVVVGLTAFLIQILYRRKKRTEE